MQFAGDGDHVPIGQELFGLELMDVYRCQHCFEKLSIFIFILMSINSSLLIERLFADVAVLGVGEIFVCFEFDAWDILDVGS